MKESVITDSACLIALERIGQLELLPALFEPVALASTSQQLSHPRLQK